MPEAFIIAKPDVKVGVTQLVSFVHQEGGLSPLTFSDFSGIQGTRVHQAFFRKLKKEAATENIEQEYSLSADYGNGDFLMRIQGRADLIVHAAEEDYIIEVKSVAIPVTDLSTKGESLHWAQCKMYCYMYALEKRQKLLDALATDDFKSRKAVKARYALTEHRYLLAYVSSEDLQCFMLERKESFAALEEWFEMTAVRYLDFARNFRDYRLRRDRDIKQLRFPYPNLRDGQKTFMQQVLKNLKTRTPLLIQAPTGTGKTISTLYPSVKALGAQLIDQIFYLTAKTSTRMVAQEALDALTEGRFALRRLTLTAKEQLCLAPELYCDTRICPYASSYYNNLQAGLAELLLNFSIDAEKVQEMGLKHRLCPFELSLDAALYCDVIIGDYNHAFDPRVRLQRFFNVPQSHFALLVDEAHNLPDRMREMYSASLTDQQVLKAAAVIKEYFGEQERYFAPLLRYMDSLKAAIKLNQKAFDLLEDGLDPQYIMQAENYRAMRQPASRFIHNLRSLSFVLRELLDDIYDLGKKRIVLDFYFSALFFLRVADEFFNERYVFSAQIDASTLEIRMLCLDASDRLIALYRNRHAALFFSATLTPMPYFATAFCGVSRDDKPDQLLLPSPFPAENLSLCIFDEIRTSYQERSKSLSTLVKLVANTVIVRPGKYLLFFPSYSYMKSSLPYFQRIFKERPIELLVQSRGMKDSEKRSFLAKFDATNPRSLLGIALLGGIFGEGIDLSGERLHGVIIVGTGIPQLSPERELMKQYFDESNRQGFQYAYQFPGFNKVLQAAGRLIRSENDKGIILLLDQRYARPDYRQLFPEEWNPVFVSDLQELKEVLAATPNYTDE